MIYQINIDKKRKFCLIPIDLLDVVGARLAREADSRVYLIHRIRSFASTLGFKRGSRYVSEHARLYQNSSIKLPKHVQLIG